MKKILNFIKKLKGNKDLNVSSNEESTKTEKTLDLQIQQFKLSKKRLDMITAEMYYVGKHDILSRQRTIIGQNGELEHIDNLPNNKIVDNQYQKMVDQKNNYLLGKPFSIQCENREYTKILKNIFDRNFLRLLRNIGEDSLNNGLAWVYIYYDEEGLLSFKTFKPYEILPIWSNEEHTKLKEVIRVYEEKVFINKKEVAIEKIEVYGKEGIKFFERDKNGKIIPSTPHQKSYITIDGIDYNFNKIPIIPFKYNNKEIPLINKVKSLQDGINIITSNFQNQMEEDVRNTILVLVNYDGENLGEFRKNLATYGAVKVKTIDGGGGEKYV